MMSLACSEVKDPRRRAYYVEQWCTLLQRRETRLGPSLVVHQPSELENSVWAYSLASGVFSASSTVNSVAEKGVD